MLAFKLTSVPAVDRGDAVSRDSDGDRMYTGDALFVRQPAVGTVKIR